VRQRIITAILLITIVLLGLFFAPPAIFNWIILFLTAVAAWEWSNLADLHSESWRSVYVLIVLLLAALFLTWPTRGGLDLALLIFWLILGICLVFYPKCEPLLKPKLVRGGIGLVALVPWPASMVQIHSGGQGLFSATGSIDLLAVLVFVWCVDTGAYFIGARFGKTKLAPYISPKKTIAGFWGGLLLPLLVAITIGVVQGHTALALQHWAFVTLGIVIFAVIGDLVESMLKRVRNIKDSGQLLPGHGGLLDRIDSLLPVITLYAALLPLGVGL
jgi:phosphatidate cytidylyltransferase